MFERSLVERTAGRYADLGRFHRRFVRAKLLRDPVYAAIVKGDTLPGQGTLVDLGCGRGILLAVLRESGSALRLIGIERGPSAEVARQALGDGTRVVRGELRDVTVPDCDAATLLDVLHYLEPAAQEELLSRVARVLRPGGVLVIRDADAGAGWRFVAVRIAERLASVLRGAPLQTLHYRSEQEWSALLRMAGLSVSSRPMGDGTPFANVLLVGRKDGGRRAE